MNSIKILIIGDKNTGKTALVEKIVHNKFTITKHIPTFGVNFSQKIIETNNRVDDGVIMEKTRRNNKIKKNNKKIKTKQKIKLEFWDCSGSEEYIYFINILYPEVEFILLCFDISEEMSFQSLTTFWLPFLKQNNVNSKIIIIGNKNDLQTEYSIKNSNLIVSEYALSLNLHPKIFLFSAKTDCDEKYEELICNFTE